MSRIYAFMKRERLYILLLIFVALLTSVLLIGPSLKVKHKSANDRPAVSEITKISSAEKNLKDREAVEEILRKNRSLAVIVSMVTLLMIAVFLLGIMIDIIFVTGLRTGKDPFAPKSVAATVSWGIWDVFKVVILYLFFSYMMMISEAFLMRVVPILKNNNFRMILNSSIMDVLIVFFMIDLAVFQYKDKLESLGLSLKNFFRNVFYGIMAYVALVPVLIGLVTLIAAVISLTSYTPQKQPVVDLFLKEKSATFLLYTSLFAAIVGPIIEELFFRGFFYNAAKKRVGIFWSTIITASVFALLHAHLVGFLPIMALGILLAYLYEKTGSLVSSVTVHMIHNVSMVFLVFLVKHIGVYR